MRIKSISLAVITLLGFTQAAWADYDPRNPDRVRIINQYVADLGRADYQDIISLFTKNGTVVSTSRGKLKAEDFFNSFLANVTTAKSTLNFTFIPDRGQNTYAARFHFSYTLKDGEKGEGEYMDEFEFSPRSAKLVNVSMFENLKISEESK